MQQVCISFYTHGSQRDSGFGDVYFEKIDET